MSISRRNLLLLTGGIVATSTATLLKINSQQIQSTYIRQIIKKRADYLKYSDLVAKQFTDDFIRFVPAFSDLRGYIVSIQGVTLSRFSVEIGGVERKHQLEAFEERIISDFLKATDFFDFNANIDRELSYVSFPDPYGSTCRNSVATIA